MFIARGIAGARGRNPIGVYIHNDAGGQNANTQFYRNYLQTANLEKGFTHYYVADDGILQAEDDSNKAWHCGETEGNNNYLSIEACQSMGDVNIFRANEERALRLAADKCRQYGITPSGSTIRLHQEVFATACPHRSIEIHGGRDGCKEYFIRRVRELMGSGDIHQTTKEGKVTTMQCFYTVDGRGPIIYFDGRDFHPLSHPDEVSVLNSIYKANNGKDMPSFSWTSGAPWHVRLEQAIKRVRK